MSMEIPITGDIQFTIPEANLQIMERNKESALFKIPYDAIIFDGDQQKTANKIKVQMFIISLEFKPTAKFEQPEKKEEPSEVRAINRMFTQLISAGMWIIVVQIVNGPTIKIVHLPYIPEITTYGRIHHEEIHLNTNVLYG